MRLIDLETRQAFQEDTLIALNDALVQQQQHIERLQKQVLALVEQLHAQEEYVVGVPDIAPPPHY